MTKKWVKNGQKNMIQLFDFFCRLAGTLRQPNFINSKQVL